MDPNQFLAKKVNEVKKLLGIKAPTNKMVAAGFNLGTMGIPFAGKQGIK